MDTATRHATSDDVAHDGVVTDPRRQRLILIAMCTALVAVIASVSGLNVAQQELAVDLGASQSQLLWIINGYTIALAALLLPIGAIGDRWGRKPSCSPASSCSPSPTSAAAFADLVDGADRRPRRRRCRRSDDHAGHAVGHHVELPGRGPGPGGRHLGRLRRRRRHPRPVRLVVHDRQLHLAVAVRHAGRCSPSSRSCMTLRAVGNTREDQAGRFDIGRLGAVGARHRRRSCSASTKARSRAGPAPLTVAGLVVGVARARRLRGVGAAPRRTRCSTSALFARPCAWPPAR